MRYGEVMYGEQSSDEILHHSGSNLSGIRRYSKQRDPRIDIPLSLLHQSTRKIYLRPGVLYHFDFAPGLPGAMSQNRTFQNLPPGNI